MNQMKPTDTHRILDVGVTDATWRASNFFEAMYPWPSSITAVAPSPMSAFSAAHPAVRLVVADGRELPFPARSFDIGFSNAVIEHVGSRDEQRRFIAEMVRTCERVFVCTPNAGFPVDPHTLLPFVHWLPRSLRHPLLRVTGNSRWASPESLNPLRAHELLALFPKTCRVRLVRQRWLGMTTVLVAIAKPTPAQ